MKPQPARDRVRAAFDADPTLVSRSASELASMLGVSNQTINRIQRERGILVVTYTYDGKRRQRVVGSAPRRGRVDHLRRAELVREVERLRRVEAVSLTTPTNRELLALVTELVGEPVIDALAEFGVTHTQGRLIRLSDRARRILERITA